MHPKKKPLSLTRETLRRMTPLEMSEIRGGIIVPTRACTTAGCPTYRHSCFDSCYDTDCCLMVP
jgi:hypothetical protein